MSEGGVTANGLADLPARLFWAAHYKSFQTD
ncbi:hypothetical protein DSW25_09630 [Sulfitobacter donghicola DSW-25 = KCTC 12864 = JCM 14565]|uniref:Uncharacterized protein n=1 Tax=Sulfitobacter donghicola DSW-25 = KCTC 12864 = JCM 14565 TaxID=1300350 RepID=A0A073IJF2_9RHOB|nr:hypothetical protein DSW25_09630 [Sulfitobacter donghicola DSW-25 = KCTC 12864 = JCM 14565]